MGNHTYALVHPRAAEALLDEADFEHDERLPYWADLWPSATALARYLDGQNLSGVRAVELGCGVGLPTVVALLRGAKVTATDHYRAALDFTRYNARVNLGNVDGLQARILDWHAPKNGFSGFDLVLAADVLYEKRNVEALVGLIPTLLSPGGEALISDPGRRWEPLFRESMRAAGFGFTTEETTVDEAGKRGVTVLIHRLRR